jgi:biotin operon repressor
MDFQAEIQAVEAAVHAVELPAGLRRVQVLGVYMTLVARVLAAGAEAAVPADQLAHELGMGKRAVLAAVRVLESIGCLQVERRPTTRRSARGYVVPAAVHVYQLRTLTGAVPSADPSAPSAPRFSPEPRVTLLFPRSFLDTEQEQETRFSPEPTAAAPSGGDLLARLLATGMERRMAQHILATRPAEEVERWLAALADQRGVRNPAGWLITALRGGWELPWRTVQRLTAARRREEREASEQAAAVAEAARQAEERAASAAAQAWLAAADPAVQADVRGKAEARVRADLGRWGQALGRLPSPLVLAAVAEVAKERLAADRRRAG